MTVKGWTRSRIIAFSIICVFALLLILGGVYSLLGNSILTFSFALLFFLVPGLLILGCFFLIRSKMRVFLKCVLCVFSVFVFLFLELNVLFWGEFRWDNKFTDSAALAAYEKTAENVPEFPNSQELGQYTAIEYHALERKYLFFMSESRVLLCRYSDSEYALQKSMLEKRCVFREEPLTASEYSCAPTKIIEGYHFQLLAKCEDPEQHLDYPKRMFFVITNDTTREIGYLYFHNFDLDYIISMTDHILNDCGWKYIR